MTASINLTLVWLIDAITNSGVLVACFLIPVFAAIAFALTLQNNQKQSALLFAFHGMSACQKSCCSIIPCSFCLHRTMQRGNPTQRLCIQSISDMHPRAVPSNDEADMGVCGT